MASMGDSDNQDTSTKVALSAKKKCKSSGGSKQSPTVKTAQDEPSDSVFPVPAVSKDPTKKSNTKASTTKTMKVSFCLVGRVRSSTSHPKRDKVVSFLQLGRLATSTPASLPSLRDILAKSSSCASEIGDPDTTPQPKKSVAQWLRNLHTPDSMESGGTPVLARREGNCVDREIQTSQCLVVDTEKEVL